jgi:hypothetical protein
MFGLPAGDDGSRGDALMANIVACNDHHHDFGVVADDRVDQAVVSRVDELPDNADERQYSVAACL